MTRACKYLRTMFGHMTYYTADATADAMENKADAMDTTTDGMDTKGENSMEAKADRIRESGEAKADAMEDKADKMDKTPG